MPRLARIAIEQIKRLFQFGVHALDTNAKLDQLQEMRRNPEQARLVDKAMLDQIEAQHRSLKLAQEHQERLGGVLEKLSGKPWFPAVYLGPAQGLGSPVALVRHGNSERVVGLMDVLMLELLYPGDRVYLAHELNVIMSRAPESLTCAGELCSFSRMASEGRLVIEARGEQYLVYASTALREVELKPGDQLCWDREALVASERIERSTESQHFIEETPKDRFEDIGGLKPQIESIRNALTLHLDYADLAREYGLKPGSSILLCGPAGTGKTFLAKATANWLAEVSPGKRALFMNIKPASLHSVYYSQSEANYREVFRVARETAARNPDARVVLFFDELDSIGGSRGAALMQIHDNVLTALLAELDGLSDRGDILVIGATNRRDSLDAALLRPGRFGDLILEVPRPDRRGCLQIFERYLGKTIPYARNGHGEDLALTREDILNSAASTIFSPNGDNQLVTITFRDGRTQIVRSSDLVSGAVVANIARSARERACLRQAHGGERGVTWEDVAQSISREFETAARGLTPANCRMHVEGLPQDMDIVKVEPTTNPGSQAHRYLNVT